MSRHDNVVSTCIGASLAINLVKTGHRADFGSRTASVGQEHQKSTAVRLKFIDSIFFQLQASCAKLIKFLRYKEYNLGKNITYLGVDARISYTSGDQKDITNAR